MQTRYVYLNGHIVSAEQASISPFDIGLLRGYAVFDLLRTVGGRPFLLAEHLQRLRSSAAHLDLTVPATDDEISEAIGELLARNGHDEATVRLVLTGGVSSDGISFDPDTPTFYIVTHELHLPPASLYEAGGRLVTQEHRREVPAAKTTNYITMLQNRERLAEAGALDLLYHDGNRVFEAASASVYSVRGSTIYAPETDVLWGTVGTLMLERARGRYDVVRLNLSLAELLASDEVFLTSTTRGVVPIVAIDDHVIGSGVVGPVTRALIDEFRALTGGD